MATIRLDSFKGINNKAHASKMPDGYLRECINVMIDNSGMITKRNGYAEKDTGVFSWIWSDELRCFAVRNGDLVEVVRNGANYTFTTIRAGVGYVMLAFTECDGNYFYCGSAITGIISGTTYKTFGQAQVNVQPTLTAATGTMAEGTYLVAVTTMDASGIESGTREPTSITLAANKQIALSNIPISSDPRVTKVCIYCSGHNGTELYRVGTVNNGVTTYSITAVNVNKFPLQTIGISPAPYGSLITYHYGHLYIANSNFLYYSDPWQYERWQPLNNYRFPTAITAIMPLESGIWISTLKDGLFFISGKSPHQGLNALGDMQRFKKHSASIKRDSYKLINAEFIGNGAPANVWMATANDGLFLLMDGGQFTIVSHAINMPEFDTCTGVLIDDTDSYKYLAIIAGASVPTAL